MQVTLSLIGQHYKTQRPECNYAYIVQLLKIKLYINCGITAVVMGMIVSMMGYILSTFQKHNRLKIEHNRPGLNHYTMQEVAHSKQLEGSWHYCPTFAMLATTVVNVRTKVKLKG